ncbi:MAG: HDOD domain-containing protein [Pseudomonadota bacterium]
MSPTAAPVAAAPAVRKLGRFELRQLVGRSARCMAWRAFDPRSAQELVLVLPRQQPADAGALAAWLDQARRGARLTHPNLAHAIEVGEQERWPFIAYDGALGPTLAERAAPREGDAAADIARWMAQALAGLAFAHDAGLAHRDVQPFLLTLADNGGLRVLGLEVAGIDPATRPAAPDAPGINDDMRQARSAAERDVLALSIVMHGLLTGAPPLEQPDVAGVIARLPPLGRETLRLPWDLPRPIAEALRAIANRATDRQPRQRYRNARTLARALEGWLENDGEQGSDAHAQLIERVRQIGALPALPGAAARAARLALMEREHTEELAQVVLRDPALSFELLRGVNSASVRGTQVSGNGPVLTVRRAIAMVGLDGVRRSALALRHWPGPLDTAGAHDLERAIGLAQRAARVAQSLRPAGYDAEVVSLVALLQNLGRLVVQYHHADEMRQVQRLMQPAPVDGPDGTPEPGMTEQAAAFAVLGADIEGMGAAVARWWGMDDAVLHMIRRLPAQLPVRQADSDDDVLRCVASAANEAVDALSLPSPQQQVVAIERVAQRYARTLDVTARDIHAALQASSNTGAFGTDEEESDQAAA